MKIGFARAVRESIADAETFGMDEFGDYWFLHLSDWKCGPSAAR